MVDAGTARRIRKDTIEELRSNKEIDNHVLLLIMLFEVGPVCLSPG